ncbi:hypothetical protein ACFPVT_00220 [Corynebacterium choanae]|uniref:hypothetical protein n=1 Tax=Corynebacterium choanae TaxID=1862358 RepID=UPI000F4DBF67|nr:hypothetical protein [Corynebacterium choanae]
MGKKKDAAKKVAKARKKLASGRCKGKCCKSAPRCLGCPVVVHRLQKWDASTLSDKQFAKVLAAARKK